MHNTSPPLPCAVPVQIESLVDLLVMIATNVYQASPAQLTALMLLKMLGQDTIDSLIYK